MDGILISVILPGRFKTVKKHNTKQKIRVNYPNKKFEIKSIKHTDAEIFECRRVTKISDKILSDWIDGDCPSWENPRSWKKMSSKQKIDSYVKTFDEGFGVFYE